VPESPLRALPAPWVLFGLAGAAAVLGAPSPWVFLACCVALWALPALYPSDLYRPQGLGAWSLWAVWQALCAYFSTEPLLAADSLWRRATGILILALAYSWWGRPHRRFWLTLVWGAGLASAAGMLAFGRASSVLVGLVCAAAGACLGVLAREMPERETGRLAARALLVAFGAISILAVSRHASQLGEFAGDRARAWSAAAQSWSAHPASGVGPGRFVLGSDELKEPPGESGWPRYLRTTSARSEPLDNLAESGLIGMALLLVACSFSLPRRNAALAREWERRGAAGAAWGLAVFALFDDLLAQPALMVLWFTALACAAQGSDEQEPRPFRVPLPLSAGGALLCVFIALPAAYVVYAAEHPSLPALHRAAWVAAGDPDLMSTLADAELAETPAQLGRAVELLEAASRSSPRRADLYLKRAQVFLKVGATTEAVFWATRSLVREPEQAAARVFLIELYESLGQKDKAREQRRELVKTLAARHEAANDYERRLLEVAPARLAAALVER
jgi:tetratricopeptide (TPR) repeat protein